MDFEIGRLLDYLNSNPQFSETAIVVVADHGNYCFDSTMAVPLLVNAPGQTSGANSQAVASVVDVAPTIANFLDINNFKSELDGIDLLHTIPLERSIYLESYQAYFTLGWSPTWGWVTKNWKYFNSGSEHLFDITQDPQELQDLANSKGQINQTFRQHINEIFNLPALATQLANGQDPDLVEAIQALGYAEAGEWGSAPPLPFSNNQLIDPFGKSNNLVKQAKFNDLWAQGKLRKAEVVLRELVAENPNGIRNLDKFGALLVKFNKTQEAIPHLLKVINNGGASDITYGNLASCYIQNKLPELAINALKLALQLKPDNANYRGALVQNLQQLGRTKEAKYFQAGGAVDGEYAAGRLNQK